MFRSIVCAAVAATTAGAALAGTVNLSAYTNNSTISSQISTSITITSTASTVTFTLNNATDTGRIDSFYIESGSALSGVNAASAVINNGAGVLMGIGATPNTPSGGIEPSWSGSFFRMSAQNPQKAVNGVDFGETVSVSFTHNGNFSVAALLDAIAANEVRFAMHYQGFGPGIDSEWLSTVAIVPLPPAAWAGLATLGACIAVRRLRRA